MSAQPEMFPMSEEERIALLRKNLQSAVDKLLAKRDAAAVALADAQDAEDLSRGLLAVFDSMVRERASQRGKTIMQEAADIVNSGALDTEGMTVTASVSPSVTPADFDAEGAAIYPPSGHDVPAAMGERPDVRNLLLDPITGEVAPAVVFAVYPGWGEPHVTPVGDRTRYSELVADYFTAAGLSTVVDADEWEVVARRELTQDGGGYRSLHDIIAPTDYGQELLVVAADQGSVTGTPAEKGAA